MARKRKIPLRMCIVCRTQQDKRDLIRFVRTPDGAVVIDPTGKRSGRGAYVCYNESCIDKALRSNQLSQALKTAIRAERCDELRQELEELKGKSGESK